MGFTTFTKPLFSQLTVRYLQCLSCRTSIWICSLRTMSWGFSGPMMLKLQSISSLLNKEIAWLRLCQGSCNSWHHDCADSGTNY